MTTPRHQLIDPQQPAFYHITSRCVRRARLCGKANRRNYNHRKRWLIKRLHQLTPAFPIQLHTYAIMPNHFHLVVYFDPQAHHTWSDEELLQRWFTACPVRDTKGRIDHELQNRRAEQLKQQPHTLQHLRAQLGSLSVFMKWLKQSIARRANLEDDCTGHFFEQRFYSGALLTEAALLGAMAYVDLNPIRAGLVRRLEDAGETGLAERLARGELGPMRPVVIGINAPTVLGMDVTGYVSYVRRLMQPAQLPVHERDRWQQAMTLLKRRQRVYGSLSLLQQWVHQRGWQMREQAWP